MGFFNIKESVSSVETTGESNPRIITLDGKKVKVLGIRRLTPTECARLQTIPEWYKWECSDSQQYKMLGNGWTVEVIKHVFSFLPYNKRIKTMETTNRQELLIALKKILPGVEKGVSLIEGSDLVYIHDGLVSSYNGEVAVTAPCTLTDIDVSLKGMDLYNIINKMTDTSISISVSDNKLKLKCGRTVSRLSLVDSKVIKAHLSTINYNDIQFKELPQDLLDGIALCVIGSKKDAMAGIAVNTYDDVSYVYSTDEDRICSYKLNTSVDSLWIDDAVYLNAIKLGIPKYYNTNGLWIHFKYEDGTIFSSRVRPVNVYPFDSCKKYLGMLESADTLVTGRFPAEFSDVVSRVSVLASGVDATLPLVGLTFTSDNLEVYAEKSNADASEVIPWTLDLSEPVKVWVPVRLLLSASNKSMEFSLVKFNGVTALVFKTENYIQMICTLTKD